MLKNKEIKVLNMLNRKFGDQKPKSYSEVYHYLVHELGASGINYEKLHNLSFLYFYNMEEANGDFNNVKKEARMSNHEYDIVDRDVFAIMLMTRDFTIKNYKIDNDNDIVYYKNQTYKFYSSDSSFDMIVQRKIEDKNLLKDYENLHRLGSEEEIPDKILNLKQNIKNLTNVIRELDDDELDWELDDLISGAEEKYRLTGYNMINNQLEYNTYTFLLKNGYEFEDILKLPYIEFSLQMAARFYYDNIKRSLSDDEKGYILGYDKLIRTVIGRNIKSEVIIGIKEK